MEFWILWNICYLFSTPQNQFYWSKFSCLTNKKFIFFVKSKRKRIHNKYYVIFKIQNSIFRTLANQWMGYQGHQSWLHHSLYSLDKMKSNPVYYITLVNKLPFEHARNELRIQTAEAFRSRLWFHISNSIYQNLHRLAWLLFWNETKSYLK